MPKHATKFYYTLFVDAFRDFGPPKIEKCRNRLRIGFHALRGHEGGFVRGTARLINGLDKKRFEIFVFVPKNGMAQCRGAVEDPDVLFVPLSGSFEKMVRTVRETACDLIYYRKAGSDPWSYFFPFTRCAKIQVTSYGTHGTSGIEAVDYFLSSTFVEPDHAQQYYTERLFNLDAMPTCQHFRPLPGEPPARREFDLPPGRSIYFCPHRTGKYHPAFDPLLKEIAVRDPDGLFVLLLGRDPKGRKELTERLAKNLGTRTLERFRFMAALPAERYNRLFSLSTALLDSPVYAGGLTSFDAFTFGVPEVTLTGPLHTQNFASGIYRCMGMDDLPCRSPSEYVDLAVRLGTDVGFRNSVVRTIEHSRHKIFEEKNIIDEHARFFETACSVGR